MRWTVAVTSMEYMRKSLKHLFEERDEKIQFSRPRRGWEDNIKIDLKEIGYETETALV
jgi:hypothetical protein